MSEEFLLAPRILNSTIAGTIATLIVYPVDLVKTRFQTQTVGKDGKRAYTSLSTAFARIYKHEGFLGLYRGLAVSILFMTPELVANITGNDFFRHLLKPAEGPQNLYRQTLAATLTGMIVVTIATPMEFLKIQLQDEGRSLEETSSSSVKKLKLTGRAVVKTVFKKRGFVGMYQGLLPCALRDIPFSMTYFPLFAILYDIGPKRKDGEATAFWSLFAGVIAGSVSAFLFTPVDVVKTRLQTLHIHGMQCKGIIDCFRRIYKNEGITAFYRGALCRVLVVAPLFGITEMIYYFGVAEYLLNIPTQTFVR